MGNDGFRATMGTFQKKYKQFVTEFQSNNFYEKSDKNSEEMPSKSNFAKKLIVSANRTSSLQEKGNKSLFLY